MTEWKLATPGNSLSDIISKQLRPTVQQVRRPKSAYAHEQLRPRDVVLFNQRCVCKCSCHCTMTMPALVPNGRGPGLEMSSLVWLIAMRSRRTTAAPGFFADSRGGYPRTSRQIVDILRGKIRNFPYPVVLVDVVCEYFICKQY